ncbi:MAG: hypothetical protein ACK4F6_16890 [Hylemonella sp.]
MVNVTPIPSPRAGAPLDGIARQQHIENALSTALHLVRQSRTTPSALRSATARAVRAATLLKHACESVNSQVMED